MAPRAPRRRDAERQLLDVVAWITDRDRTICRPLDEHRVLTTSQVTDIGLSGERRTRMRLSKLYGLRRSTTSDLDYRHATCITVLGPIGAALVAAERGFGISELDRSTGLLNDHAHPSGRPR
jgi:hypothetical protein